MEKNQTYIDGFLQGWTSVAGPRLHFPEIPAPSIQGNGSPFIHGLMEGIKAAKKADRHSDVGGMRGD
jgi:hypothetical protein